MFPIYFVYVYDLSLASSSIGIVDEALFLYSISFLERGDYGTKSGTLPPFRTAILVRTRKDWFIYLYRILSIRIFILYCTVVHSFWNSSRNILIFYKN